MQNPLDQYRNLMLDMLRDVLHNALRPMGEVFIRVEFHPGLAHRPHGFAWLQESGRHRARRIAPMLIALAVVLPAPSLGQVAPASEALEPNQQSDVAPLEVQAERPRAFFADTSFVIKPRAYYLDRDRDVNRDNVGLAAGGALQYLSGWAFDRVQLRATAYTSQVVYGPSDKDGTLLFLPGPESFTVLGEANAVFRFTEKDVLRVGRQLFELPYLGSHDVRMVPNTFEAVAVGNASQEGLAYIVGYVNRIKSKNDDDFVAMSEAAGVDGGDDGVVMVGARYVFEDGTEIAAIDQKTSDVFNTLFAKVEKKFALADDRSLNAFLQYTDQRSVGDDLIGEFDTTLLSAKLEYSAGHATIRLGASATGSERGIQKPYGNPANYLSVIVEDFDRAGEDAWMIGGNYDFERVGPGELSMFANVVTGNTPDSGPDASPDQTEYDLTADYRIKEGSAKHLWIRIRTALIDQDETVGGDDFLDFRIIVNWDFATSH